MTAHSKDAKHTGYSQGPATGAVGVVAPETIARRAYELFQDRGGQPGCELDDWLRAERELKESKSHRRAE